MIYICVPTYNEARTVGVLLWKIRQVMTEFPRDYCVLVADDASTDATPEVLAPYTRVLPLTVYRHEERHGYAASTEMLLREVVRRSDYPRRDIIVTLQADFTEEPDEIPTLVRRIEGGVDVVTGALVLRDAHAPRSVSWTHKLLGYLVRRGRWPEGVTDPLSGFRAYRVITVKRALDERAGRPLFRGEGWAANMELLRAVIPFARRVDEAPVSIRYDRRLRESRFRPWETVRSILSLLRPGATAEGEAGETEERSGAGWEEVAAGGALAGAGDRTRRNGQRDGARRPGGQRARREAVDATGERRPAGEGRTSEARAAGGGPGDRPRGGEARRRRRPAESVAVEAEGAEGAEVTEEKAAPGGTRRRRSQPRRKPAEGAAAEAAQRAEAAQGEAGATEAPAGASGGRRRRRRRGGGGGQRRESGAARENAPDRGASGARQGERQGAATADAAGAAGADTTGAPRAEGEGQPARPAGSARRGARRGGRRGGRRTRTRPPGTSGEEPSSGPATEE